MPRPGATALAVVAALSAVAGCESRAVEGASGGVVEAASGARIVSALPALTPIVVELAGSAALVGTATGDPDPSARALPRVGDLLAPSAERVVALDPTIVYGWKGTDWGAIRGGLAPGATVVRLDVQTLDDLERAIARVGSDLGRQGAADSMVAALRSDRARRCDWEGSAPRAVWITWAEPLSVAGPGSHLHDLMEIAGVENAIGEGTGPWPVLSRETLVRLDPEVVIWTGGDDAPVAGDGPLSAVTAVASGRVVALESDRWHTPRVDAPARARELAAVLARHSTDAGRPRCPTPATLHSPPPSPDPS